MGPKGYVAAMTAGAEAAKATKAAMAPKGAVAAMTAGAEAAKATKTAVAQEGGGSNDSQG
jgi:hypothetical protein